MIPSTRIKHLHFIGIGGSGMSGMAEVLHENGFRITGSDMNDSSVVQYLRDKGISISIGHQAENIAGADIVVYSSAVKMSNPEVEEAVNKNIPVIRRAEMLGELMRLKYTIAVAGTHGKTTTTSLIGCIWEEAEQDPTIIVGGVVRHLGTGARLGSGDALIAEADEYDRSFLSMVPTLALISNVDEDHLDCYEDLDDIKKAFIQFANKVPFYGQVVVCIDDPGVRDILPAIRKPVVSYGFSSQADYRIQQPTMEDGFTSFRMIRGEDDLGVFKMRLVGRHNVLNAAGAIAMALEEGILPEYIRSGLEKFSGVKRRLEFLGEVKGVQFYDDYAHHPAEVKATLQGLRDLFPERKLHVLFQPHLFSRTRDHHGSFGEAFLDCDTLVVLPVYPAREQPIEGVSGRLVSQSAIQRGHKSAAYAEVWDQAWETLLPVVKKDDFVVVMGAGDVWKIAEPIMKKLEDYSHE